MTGFATVKINNWNDFVIHINNMDHNTFGFRGQRNINWKLEPSLERICPTKCTDWKSKVEKRAFLEFKIRATNYLTQLPTDEDYLNWLSLIQHFGGATRLLDFTWSGFIAAFFAFEDLAVDGKPVVWAVNTTKLILNAAKYFKGDLFKCLDATTFSLEEEFNKILHTQFHPLKQNFAIRNEELIEKNFIIPLITDNRHQRLNAQRGLFLANLHNHDDFSFGKGLINSLNMDITTDELYNYYTPKYNVSDKDDLNQYSIVRFEFSPQILSDVFIGLLKMNISSETLFPDITGLAKSTKYMMRANYFYTGESESMDLK